MQAQSAAAMRSQQRQKDALNVAVKAATQAVRVATFRG
jgi:hypothetical protein